MALLKICMNDRMRDGHAMASMPARDLAAEQLLYANTSRLCRQVHVICKYLAVCRTAIDIETACSLLFLAKVSLPNRCKYERGCPIRSEI